MYNRCVRGCKGRTHVNKEFSFYRFLKERSWFDEDLNSLIRKQQEAWWKAIPLKRAKGGIPYKDMSLLDELRICSEHFRYG